jgi:hypothetical protein
VCDAFVEGRNACLGEGQRRKGVDGVQGDNSQRERVNVVLPAAAVRTVHGRHRRPGFWIAAWAENGPTPDLVRTEPGTVRSLEVGTVA